MNTSPAADAAILCFNPIDAAFALAWADHVPDARWSVYIDTTDDGAEYLTMETCSGLNVVGYHVLPVVSGGGVTATLNAWDGRAPTLYPSLRPFLSSIHPVSDAALLDIEAGVTKSMGLLSGQR